MPKPYWQTKQAPEQSEATVSAVYSWPIYSDSLKNCDFVHVINNKCNVSLWIQQRRDDKRYCQKAGL